MPVDIYLADIYCMPAVTAASTAVPDSVCLETSPKPTSCPPSYLSNLGVTLTPPLPSGSTISHESYPEYLRICSSCPSRWAPHKITHVQAAGDLAHSTL